MKAYAGLAPDKTKDVERVSQVKRVIELDFLRGIAILLVLTSHYTPGMYDIFHVSDFGWAGVNLFFVLSGFLVHTWSLAVEEHFYLLLTAFLMFAYRRKASPGKVLVTCLIAALSVTIIRCVSVYYYGWNVVFYTHTRITLFFSV